MNNTKEMLLMEETKGKTKKEKFDETVSDFKDKINRAATDVSEKTKIAVSKSKDAVVKTIDMNGDGQIDIEDVIILGLKTPGVWIKREEFLKKEFLKRYPADVIDDAIKNNPAHAGIPNEDINKIADEVIKFERYCVSGISAALGAPGGVAMVATIPADIVQYYGYLLRAS